MIKYKIYTKQGDLSKIEYEYVQIVNGFYKHFYRIN